MANTNTNKPVILESLQGCEVMLTMPYKAKNSLDGFEHPSILVLKDGRVCMPVLKMTAENRVENRKFVLLGHLVPALENGEGLFVSPTALARQLEINLGAIASRLRDYRLTSEGVIPPQTANRALVISINL